MLVRAVLLGALLLGGLHLAAAQWPGIDHGWVLPQAERWNRWADGARTLPDAMRGQAAELLAARRQTVARLQTEADWQHRSTDVRAKFSQIFDYASQAEAPERRTPLNPHVTKRTVHPTLNATVEMLYFESRPGFFVTAGLWLPADDAPGKDPVTGKRSGILFASGHSCQAWRRLDEPDYFDYHFLLLQLVRKGFVVLAYDPPGQGERLMYTNGTCPVEGPRAACTRYNKVGGCAWDINTGVDLPWSGGSTNEHSYLGWQLLLNNVTAASVWVWDGTRALDYLMSRPEVATERIGMTGCSGGGTQTAYLSSVDRRIQAASVGCYSSAFEVDFAWQGSADAEQVWPSGLRAGLNKADLSVSRGYDNATGRSQATQLLLTSLDQCFPLAGGRMCFADAEPAFAGSANITKAEAEGPHGMQNGTRQALYAFMQQHLQKIEPNTTEDFGIKPFKMSEVIALPTGSVVDDLHSKTVANLSAEFTAHSVAHLERQRSSASRADFLKNLGQVAAKLSGFEKLPPLGAHNSADGLPDATLLGEITGSTRGFDAGLAVSKWYVQTEGGCGVVVTARCPRNVSSVAHPVVLLIDDSGHPGGPGAAAETAIAHAMTSQLAAVGYCVAVVNLCGFGEVGPAFGPTQPGGMQQAGADPPGYPPQAKEQRAAALAGEGPTGLATFTGRSLVGRHAAELVRVCEQLLAQPTISRLAALVAADHTDAAALHAVAVQVRSAKGGQLVGVIPGKPVLVLVDACPSWASIGAAPYYAAPVYRTVVGALKQYDLPDLAAAALQPGATNVTPGGTVSRMLVIGPRSALLEPLTQAKAEAEYAFVRESGGSVTVASGQHTPAEVVSAVLAFLGASM